MEFLLRVREEVLPQVQELKYLGIMITSEMTVEQERWFGVESAVLRALYWSIVVKRELSPISKLSIYWSNYVSTLTHGHELWVMTERRRL